MMATIIIMLGVALVIFGFILLSDDFLCGLICFALGVAIAWGGMDYMDTMNKLHDTQQQVLSIKNGYQASLNEALKDNEVLTEKATELVFEIRALQEQQSECIVKQQVSQGTLSDIKEILEN